jgi:hypothetical protein
LLGFCTFPQIVFSTGLKLSQVAQGFRSIEGS